MAVEKKVSELPTTTSIVQPTDVVVADVGSTTYKVSHNQLFTFQVGDVLSDSTYMGIVLKGILCGETLALPHVVYLDDTSGRWKKADADGTGTWPARGVVVAGGANGDACTVLVVGVIQYSTWAWTAKNKTLYLDDVTPGGITETAPAGSGDCIQVIGFALSDDEAFFNFTGEYQEHQ